MTVASMTSALALKAYDHLKNVLPTTPAPQHEAALRALLEAFTDGLEGKLEPGNHLASLDPGMGKSMAVSSFLQAWSDLGFLPAGSVLIAVSSYDEIKAYLQRLGPLGPAVGVLVSDVGMKVLELPEGDPQDAPILFTTQQMVRSRSHRTSFRSLCEFHFQGAPRSLLVWDESMVETAGEMTPECISLRPS